MKDCYIISNLQNKDAGSEDSALAKLLGIQVIDLFDDTIFLKNGFFLIRNIWGKSNSRERMISVYKYFAEKNIPYINPFNGNGDQQGKRYLVELYNKKYPVIPTFNKYKDIQTQKTQTYLLKPIHGGSGEGIIEISHDSLENLIDTEGYIIQPKIDFLYELSFFFVDSNFEYALKTINSRWDLEVYTPTKKELLIVQKFVEWNKIKGIQRIDFLKVGNSILLLEIEDWCPYLSLLDVKYFPTNKFVESISNSIKTTMTGTNSDRSKN